MSVVTLQLDTPAGWDGRQTHCPHSSRGLWPISCQSAPTSQHPLTGASPLAHSSHWPAGAQRHRVRLRHRSWQRREVTPVQTLVPVVAPNLSGSNGRIYYCVIRTQTAQHTVPGGRQVTSEQQPPSGAAPRCRSLRPLRIRLVKCTSLCSVERFFYVLPLKSAEMMNVHLKSSS